MCHTTSYHYQCGHTDTEVHGVCQRFCDTKVCACYDPEDQAVVMDKECPECRIGCLCEPETESEEGEIDEVELAWDVEYK